jgi:hypothetical protein
MAEGSDRRFCDPISALSFSLVASMHCDAPYTFVLRNTAPTCARGTGDDRSPEGEETGHTSSATIRRV